MARRLRGSGILNSCGSSSLEPVWLSCVAWTLCGPGVWSLCGSSSLEPVWLGGLAGSPIGFGIWSLWGSSSLEPSAAWLGLGLELVQLRPLVCAFSLSRLAPVWLCCGAWVRCGPGVWSLCASNGIELVRICCLAWWVRCLCERLLSACLGMHGEPLQLAVHWGGSQACCGTFRRCSHAGVQWACCITAGKCAHTSAGLAMGLSALVSCPVQPSSGRVQQVLCLTHRSQASVGCAEIWEWNEIVIRPQTFQPPLWPSTNSDSSNFLLPYAPQVMLR